MINLKDIDFDNDGFADADLNRDGVVTKEEIELYRKHIIHYFDNQLGADILNLPEEDKFRFFQCAQDYSDVFVKLFHKGINLFEHIAFGDERYFAKQDPHEGINWEYECEIVKQYEEWKKSKK
jgi:hypothetical protein